MWHSRSRPRRSHLLGSQGRRVLWWKGRSPEGVEVAGRSVGFSLICKPLEGWGACARASWLGTPIRSHPSSSCPTRCSHQRPRSSRNQGPKRSPGKGSRPSGRRCRREELPPWSLRADEGGDELTKWGSPGGRAFRTGRKRGGRDSVACSGCSAQESGA